MHFVKLFVAECWIDVSEATIKTLNSLEECFYLTALAAPRSCPKPGIYWEVGGKTAENRIIESKLLFYYHLVNLSNDTLAKKIYLEEIKLNIGGYHHECQIYLANLNINPEEAKYLNKTQWKALIRDSLKRKTRSDILDRAKPYKKVDYFIMKEEEYEMKYYLKTMKLEQARIMFSLRTKTTKFIKSHFFSDKKYASQLWKCSTECDKIDTIQHIAFACPKYEHLKRDKDLQNNDVDLVNFFQDVIKLREDEAKKE